MCSLCASGLVFVLDQLLRTRVLRQPVFWAFLAIMYCFKLAVNGYLTWRPIVLYGDEFYMGIRLFTIPLEDFVYGFSLIAASVIFWEYFKKEKGGREESS